MKLFKSSIIVVYISIFIVACKDLDEIPCIPPELKKNVRAFYSFNGGSLLDKSLEGNDLTIHGFATPTEDRYGNINCAFHFNRYNDDYLFTDGKFLNDYQNNAFSFSLWYQPTDTIFGSTYFDHDVLISRDTNEYNKCNSRIGEWSLTLVDCGDPTLRINQSNLYYNNLITPDSIIVNSCYTFVTEYAKTWHHIVGTYNNDRLKLYGNGVLTNDIQINFPDCNQSKAIGKLFIGYRFTGNLDDILIFDKELSETEVTQLNEMEPCCE